MNKINFSPVSQNKNALPSQSQPTTVSSQSKVSWGRVAKGIALLGGLVVAGYSLYLLKGRLSATLPSSCFANGKPEIRLNGTICCLGESNCNGPGAGTFHGIDGTSYPGNLANGVFTGRALITLPGGEIYDGDVRNEFRHGKGNLTWPDGTSYEGDFFNNALTGTGRFTYADKVSYYQGPFLDGRFSGKKGLLVQKDQYGFYSFKGEFLDSHPSGQVTYKDDEHTYIGAYLQGLRHGKGRVTFPDGTTCTEEWANHTLISQVCPG